MRTARFEVRRVGELYSVPSAPRLVTTRTSDLTEYPHA